MKIAIPDLHPFRDAAKLAGHPGRRVVGVVKDEFLVLRIASATTEDWLAPAVHSMKLTIPVPEGTPRCIFSCSVHDFFGLGGLVQSFKKDKSATLVINPEKGYLAMTNGKDQASVPARFHASIKEFKKGHRIFTTPAVAEWHKAPPQIIKAARQLEVGVYQEDGKQSPICAVYFGPEGFISATATQLIRYGYTVPESFSLKSDAIKQGLLTLAKAKTIHYALVGPLGEDAAEHEIGLVIRGEYLTLALPAFDNFPVETMSTVLDGLDDWPEQWPSILIDRNALEIRVDQMRVSAKTYWSQPVSLLVRPEELVIQQGVKATTIREMRVKAHRSANWNGTMEYVVALQRDALYRVVKCSASDVITVGVSPQADRFWLVNRENKYAAVLLPMN